MKHLTLPVSAFLVVALATTAFAQNVIITGTLDFNEIDLDRYSDAPFNDHQTDLAVSVLTEESILFGNDDGTFRPERTLNRAEFVQIIMRLIDDNRAVSLSCFPDVSSDVWYAEPVCRAKALGIVRGNARVGVPESQWRFEPTRAVQYEEAIKMLVEVFGHPVSGDTEGLDWYVPYIDAAQDLDLTISGLRVGESITRGTMARLTIAFLAEDNDQLDDLRDAEEGRDDDNNSSSASSSSRTSSSSSRSSNSSTTGDPDTNLSIRSNFLVLGETTPVLGAVDFFAQSEPIDVDMIRVRFSSDPSSIQQVRIYAEDDGRLLGTSFRDGSGDYEVALSPGELVLEHRIEEGVYVRALMKPADGGAAGGQIVQIEHIEVDGDGQWSDSDYTVTSTEIFLPFETTPAVITIFRSTGSVTSLGFISGPNVTLGEFDVRARSTDNDYTVALESLVFRLTASSSVTLDDVELTVPDTGASTSCTISSSTITCDDISVSVGTIDTMQRLRLIGDVTLDSGAVNPFLQVSLQEAGGPNSPGDIEWTDGSHTYDWVPFEEPVARGIRYE